MTSRPLPPSDPIIGPSEQPAPGDPWTITRQAPTSRLIVFEGMDGAGTTTQTRLLTERLRSELGAEAVSCAQPSDRPIGKLIRQALAKSYTAGPAQEALAGHTLALMFAADRLDLEQHLWQPLAGGYIVCDRHVPSSLVYQGASVDPAWLESLNSQARTPDVTFWVNVSLQTALSRVAARGGAADMFEREEAMARWHARYAKVMEWYRATWGSNRVIFLDGELPQEEVAEAAWQALRDRGLVP